MKHFLKNLLFPPTCLGCGERFDLFVEEEIPALCLQCRIGFENAKREDCPDCGKPYLECGCMPALLREAGCGAFRKLCRYRPGNRRAVSTHMILALKDRRILRGFSELGKDLAELFRDLGKEDPSGILVTYLPRGRHGRERAGFDQGKELAEAVAKAGGFRLTPLFFRTGGREQKKLNAGEREKNALREFRRKRKENITGKTILLIDDVVTTGATMSACCRLLLKDGAARVVCGAVAVTELKTGTGLKKSASAVSGEKF